MQKTPSLFERIVGKFIELLLIYILLGVVAVIGATTVLTGHFPPSKEEVVDQVGKMKEVMGRSQDIVDNIKITQERIAEVGPQFEIMGNKIQELELRIQVLERGANTNATPSKANRR